MINENQFYRWGRQKNGKGYIARVTLSIEQNLLCENKIVEHYSGNSNYSQGYIEEVSEFGYDSWKIGARHGLEFGFTLIDTFWTVNIQKIEGLSTDTNATIVAYTVLRAFLEKINFTLDSRKIEDLEALVFSSWKEIPKEFIPNFFDLTLKEYE